MLHKLKKNIRDITGREVFIKPLLSKRRSILTLPLTTQNARMKTRHIRLSITSSGEILSTR
jgi:hypothetical protein